MVQVARAGLSEGVVEVGSPVPELGLVLWGGSTLVGVLHCPCDCFGRTHLFHLASPDCFLLVF